MKFPKTLLRCSKLMKVLVLISFIGDIMRNSYKHSHRQIVSLQRRPNLIFLIRFGVVISTLFFLLIKDRFRCPVVSKSESVN